MNEVAGSAPKLWIWWTALRQEKLKPARGSLRTGLSGQSSEPRERGCSAERGWLKGEEWSRSTAVGEGCS